MPQLVARPPTISLPSVHNPAIFQQYFQGGVVQTAPLALPQASSGYSSSHLQYQEERQRWLTSAYKGSPAGWDRFHSELRPGMRFASSFKFRIHY